MPVSNYSVLKGNPISGRVVSGRGTHYQIGVRVPGGVYTAAVNIESADGSEVLYEVRTDFAPPDPAGLLALPMGAQPLASAPGGLALDFVRSSVNGAPMVSRANMTLLAPEAEPHHHGGNCLHNAVADLLDRAVADPSGVLYVFGSCYTDQGDVHGIHDIHMNQGNPVVGGGYGDDNGAWQDGALFVNLPGAGNTWTAIFLAFQTQSWSTDDSGNPN